MNAESGWFEELFARAAARVRRRGRLQAGLWLLGRAGLPVLAVSLLLALVLWAAGHRVPQASAVHEILPALLLAWALAHGLARRFDEALVVMALEAHCDTRGLIGAVRSAAPDFAALLAPLAAAALAAAPPFPLRPRQGAGILAGLALLWGLGAVAWSPAAGSAFLAAEGLRARMAEQAQRLGTVPQQRWERALAQLEQGDLVTARQELLALAGELESASQAAAPGEAQAAPGGDADHADHAHIDPLERSRLVAALRRTLAEFPADEAERLASGTAGLGRSQESFPSTVGTDTAPGHGEHGSPAQAAQAPPVAASPFPSPAAASADGEGQHIPADCREAVERYFARP